MTRNLFVVDTHTWEPVGETDRSGCPHCGMILTNRHISTGEFKPCFPRLVRKEPDGQHPGS